MFEILVSPPTIMSGRWPDIWVLGFRNQLGLQRQTWGCQDRSWSSHPGRACSARRPLQGWSMKKHIQVHAGGGRYEGGGWASPQPEREGPERWWVVHGVLEVDREQGLMGEGVARAPLTPGNLAGWPPAWDLELGVLSVGTGSAVGRGRATWPRGEGGVSRWKGALWEYCPGWNAGEIGG